MPYTHPPLRGVLLALFALLPLPAAAQAGRVVATGHDAITTPGAAVRVGAKFERDVGIWRVDMDCTVELTVGDKRYTVRSDADGVAAVNHTPAAPGVYEVVGRIQGEDGPRAAVARSRLWVVEPDRPLAVVDIDGTLSDLPEWQVPVRGDRAPTYAGAVELLRDLARTHTIVYMSARDDTFDVITRDFLRRHAFPQGPVIYNDLGLRTPAELAQLNPKNHAGFKLMKIQGMQSRRLRVALGIGNAETDGEAYVGAGLRSCLRTELRREDGSFRFSDYAELRRVLEREGYLAAAAPAAPADPPPAGD